MWKTATKTVRYLHGRLLNSIHVIVSLPSNILTTIQYFFMGISCVFVRKTEEYKVSKTGNLYKRKSVKRKIRCPLCPSSTQRLTRHLWDVHKLNSDNIRQLLASTDSYRRCKPDCWKKRVPCPVPHCMTVVCYRQTPLYSCRLMI